MAKTPRNANRGWTETEWKRMQPTADSTNPAVTRLWPKILSVRYDAPSHLVVLQLSNGARLGIPAEKLEGVATANDERRSTVTISESGWAIEFPQLDERFRVAELLTGVFGSRAWVSELERRSAASATPSKPPAAAKATIAAKSGSTKKSAAAKKVAAKPKRRTKSK